MFRSRVRRGLLPSLHSSGTLPKICDLNSGGTTKYVFSTLCFRPPRTRVEFHFLSGPCNPTSDIFPMCTPFLSKDILVVVVSTVTPHSPFLRLLDQVSWHHLPRHPGAPPGELKPLRSTQETPLFVFFSLHSDKFRRRHPLCDTIYESDVRE